MPPIQARKHHSRIVANDPSSIDSPDGRGNDQRIAELVTIGGWPDNLGRTVEQAQRLVRGYVDQVARTDVQRVDRVRRDPETVARLLRSLARNVATPASINSLRDDVNGADGIMKAETVSSYLSALARLMVTEDLPSWRPSIYSRTRLRAAAVRHLVDPSIAVASMRSTPARLLRDLGWDCSSRTSLSGTCESTRRRSR